MSRGPVFLTGGTGFVGSAVARRLAGEGRSVTALVRPGSRTEELKKLGCRLLEGSVWRPGPWMNELKGHDALIHLVGIIQPFGDNTFQSVHVQGTELVATAAQEQGVRKLVHMSALGTRPGAASQYHQTKWKAEELVRWAGPAYTIFRPSIIFGRPCPFVDMLKTFASLPLAVPVAGPGTNRFQPVWVEDVARAFVQALVEPKTDGKEYDLVGPDVLTFDEMLDVVAEALGRAPRPKLHIPLALMRLQAAALEALLPRPPVTRDQLLMLREDNVGDASRARADLGGDWRSFREWARAELSR